ncbi:hypothetical protein P775_08210 [Puniceibacterium antarcticum]|uniref:Uncharacterized protein n=1 Tax=Puniceibacterium antarcticum TaxID=1206336 RepID=A0A2G8RG84_9RHOB|nr:hypothetical protein [Puniceibacterium antarcticum]PIL20503.1 hypothetical protein P775_08210 [Puniceibacterium antarcticum]
MTRQTLKRRIDALESDISEVDADMRQEMVTRLRQLVLTLDLGTSLPRGRSVRGTELREDEDAEDAFDNMPI